LRWGRAACTGRKQGGQGAATTADLLYNGVAGGGDLGEPDWLKGGEWRDRVPHAGGGWGGGGPAPTDGQHPGRQRPAVDGCGRAALNVGTGEVGLPGGAPARFRGAWVKNGIKRFKNSNYSKNVQIFSNFDRSKFDLLELQKFERKYGFEDLKMMNNFLHKNFFRFGMKIQGIL
jgi:hypothetical protein